MRRVSRIGRARGLIAILAVAASQGCVSYKPVIVAQKTALERDLLGQFERLNAQPLLLGHAPPANPSLTPERRALLQTVLDLKLHENEVRPLKDQQVVGEASSGLLEPSGTIDDEQVTRVMKRENKLRQLLLRQLIAADPRLSASDLPQLQQAYHRHQVHNALPGERVQQADSSWQTIGAP